jgi:hypothetical protein
LILKKFEKEIVFVSSVLAWIRIRDWIRIRIEQKCWIRIRIKSIRIHNPALFTSVGWYGPLWPEAYLAVPQLHQPEYGVCDGGEGEGGQADQAPTQHHTIIPSSSAKTWLSLHTGTRNTRQKLPVLGKKNCLLF